ncbi:MAG: dicarboxylate/amino acid:cation symporter [Myxococcota bacterium]|jgi:Na+/H+-dicarboxylate symporter|nr:dicarboxylate/amino acid:cation symporter [Deltaproteobacteria bacterium]MCP4240832.1 dicarboxylate/amino acid:cation symporter [bacterium]MDP6074187.1 dicarboxylate/amino acid:cation symporter [Myxococcota bacterium]MDP6242926.1 dicarboxylate/amino acid:cation symporter [Myxococcota bacterium]MDP7073203.1 dicarboxylate/amino acid:cation symporter [Myxococcota bacterium]
MAILEIVKGGDLPEDAAGRRRLTIRILIGMAAGALAGLMLNLAGVESGLGEFLVDRVFHVGGAIFLASLKLLVVPLVFVSIVCGTAALDDATKLGRIGGRTLALYLFTTAIAISFAILVAVVVGPGMGFDLSTEVEYAGRAAPPLTETLIQIFPTNPVKAMAEGNMLQILVFAVLFGMALVFAGHPGERLLIVFQDLNVVVLRLVMMLVRLAPYGVFFLIAKVFAVQGFSAIVPLAKYFFVVLGVLAIHCLITYPLLLRFLAGLDPVTFFRKMRDPMLLAFSTASSGATLPVTLENVERRLGADNSIAAFTIPLGATINMDGTAIMQGVATVFIAQAYGVDIGISGYLMVVVTATLASIGTAAVPGVGLVMLAMVLRQVELPVEGIGLIIGVDRLLDMVRTAVNVTGDSAVACVVARGEGRLDLDVFHS